MSQAENPLEAGPVNENSQVISDAFALAGTPLTPLQADQFFSYYQDLIETNKVMNLTAITDFSEVIHKHFVDSIHKVGDILPSYPQNVIDIGCGAGFPSIPLHILHPDWNMTLVDSLLKRLSFIDRIVAGFGWDNVKTVHSRAEDLAQDPYYRAFYDLAVARAVSRLSVLCEYCLPFVRKGGYFLAYKGASADQELEEARHAIKLLGGEVKDIIHFTLPQHSDERALILIQKTHATPDKYPRKAGLPAKSPLA